MDILVFYIIHTSFHTCIVLFDIDMVLFDIDMVLFHIIYTSFHTDVVLLYTYFKEKDLHAPYSHDYRGSL